MMLNNFIFLNKKQQIFESGLFFFFFLLNFSQPLIVDDLYRSLIAAFYHGTILANLYHDYFSWTGRLSAQWLVYYFFNKPYQSYCTFIFNVLNSFAFVLLYRYFFELLTYFNKKNSLKTFVKFVIIFTFFLQLTGLLSSFLWKTAGVQYLWGLVVLLFWIKKIFLGQKNGNLFFIFSFFIGFFLGLYNEIFFSCIFLFWIFVWLLKTQKNQFSINLWDKKLIYLQIGNLIGGVILLFAPGNYARKMIMDEGKSYSLEEKFILLFQHFWESNSGKIFIVLAFFVLSYQILKYKNLKINFIFLIIFSASFLMFFPVGVYPLEDRMLIFHHLFLFFILWKILKLEDFFNINFYPLLLFGIFIFSVQLYASFDLYFFQAERLQKIKGSDSETIVLPAYHFPKYLPKLVFFLDLTEDEKHWRNHIFSTYYQLKDVKVFSESDEVIFQKK